MKRRPDAPDARPARRDLPAQLSAPLRSFISTEAGSAGLLLTAALIALVWANSPWSASYTDLWHTEIGLRVGSHAISMDLHHWVNDGLMVLYFFVIGLEVRREISVGELTSPRRAAIPLFAGFTGMLLPAVLYLAVNPSGEAARGWGIVIGTDTAFMLGALAIVGPTFATQLRIFLLTLTVIDDIVAVAVIGVVYSETIRLFPLVIAAAAMFAIALLSHYGAWRVSFYALAMAVLWFATLKSGLHPSIAGMVGGLLVAAYVPKQRDVEWATSLFRAFRQSPMPEVGKSAKQGIMRAISVNERLQTNLHPWTSYVVVPVFALANAGVDLRHGVLTDALTSWVTWGVVLGLVLGKYFGIGLGAWIGRRWGVGEFPRGVRGGHVFGGAALSGIGFTVSLLIAGLAFTDERLQDQATVGVLIAAVLSIALGWLTFRVAAVWKGQRDADLPRLLAMDIDPARDHIRGPVDAPLTLVEYSDFECPFCARTTGVSLELREHYGDRLRYVMRHLPLPDVHPHAEQAAFAAEAAALQGRFWEIHNLLFENQDELAWEDLAGYAASLELDVEQFVRDMASPAVAARVREDVASAEAGGAQGTPTFYVNGVRHVGPHDTATLRAALDASADD